MRRTVLLVSLCVAVVWSGEARPRRIIGGFEAERGQFPWQALVVAIDAGQVTSYCGGALVAADAVLTAAQCVEVGTRLEVWLGALDISLAAEEGREVLRTDTFLMHPDYSPEFFDNDLALVRLPANVTFTSSIGAIRLPRGEELDPNLVGWSGVMAGWGFDSDGAGGMHETLLFTFNEVVARSTCVANYGAQWMSDNKFCVATAGGRGPCYGDAGGPLVLVDAGGESVLMGVFSFLETASCQRGKPVGYTSVAAYLDWIEQNL